ncbi:MAG: thioredoxin domain-containing protein [Patescibacteria group bacterium]
MHNESSGVTLSPKTSFALGMIGGVLVLCTVGFFILLGLVLSGKADIGKVALADEAKAAAPTAVQPTVAEEEDAGPIEVKPIADGERVLGDENADVTLYVYTDFECPFCSRFHPSFTQVMEEFDGQIKAVIRHFPLSFHTNARPAANAAECAAEQGKYYEFIDGLFENQDRLGSALYTELAADLGLNKTKFSDCVTANKYDSKISADMAGGISAQVQGTPGTIIVGLDGEAQLVPGAVPYESLKAMVEAAL